MQATQAASEWQPFVPVVAALAGVLVGGALQFALAWANRKATAKQERRALFRTKLELLVEVLEQIAQSVRDEQAEVAQLARDSSIPTPKDHEPVPWARLWMLVRVYCPQVAADAAKLDEMRNPLGKAMLRYLHGVEDGEEDFKAACLEMLRACSALQERVANYVQEKFVA